jgi:hypothetical protein
MFTQVSLLIKLNTQLFVGFGFLNSSQLFISEGYWGLSTVKILNRTNQNILHSFYFNSTNQREFAEGLFFGKR